MVQMDMTLQMEFLFHMNIINMSEVEKLSINTKQFIEKNI